MQKIESNVCRLIRIRANRLFHLLGTRFRIKKHYLDLLSNKLEQINYGRADGLRGVFDVCLGWIKIIVSVTRFLILGLLRKLFLLVLSLMFVPVVLIVRMVRPFIHIRIGYLDVRRMGHFAVDVGTYLAENQVNSEFAKTKDLFFLKGVAANKQLALMVKRELIVSPLVKYLWNANRLFPGGKAHQLTPAIVSVNSRDTRGLFSKTTSCLSYTAKEKNVAHKILEEIGVDPSRKYVCLNVRDNAYLATYLNGSDWEYHNYRDCNIKNYEKAALELASRGYSVIRMGKVVNKKLEVNHPLIFDYANSSQRSDLLDIWLMANCFFCVSNGTGLDSICDIYRVPTVMVDFIPLTHLHSWQHAITAPKRLFWVEGNSDELCLSEVLEHSYFRSTEFVESGVRVVDLDQNEILDTVLEMEARLLNEYRQSTQGQEWQNMFWLIFRSSRNYDQLHGFVNHFNYVSTSFIERNPGWLR